MKYIKVFETFDDSMDDLEDKQSIEDYPLSVRQIYKRFNPSAKKSINDNLEKFAKIAKRVFYDEKNWKKYFDDKEFKNLNTLTEVIDSLEKWIDKNDKS